jgi:peptidoglycan/LPS O-acetylase OafA/YrhL
MVNFNILAWSLSDEAFFYAVFPALAVALFALAQRARLWSLAALAIALWGIGVYLGLKLHDTWFFYTFPPIRFLDFAIGACLGIAFITAGAKASIGFAAATALETTAVIGIAFALYAAPALPANLGHAFWAAPFCAFTIYAFAYNAGALSKLLGTAALVYSGEISYSFYMLHGLILTCVFSRGWAAPVAVSWLSLVLCVATSAIVYEKFEKPLRKRIRGFFSPSTSDVPAVA